MSGFTVGKTVRTRPTQPFTGLFVPVTVTMELTTCKTLAIPHSVSAMAHVSKHVVGIIIRIFVSSLL